MPSILQRLTGWFGSLPMAVVLLVTIAGVLAWGTIYEMRFGTAAVQRFVYQSWAFQALLAFLAVNLAVAALQRLPWRRRHLPFVLAHIGIILTLIGGIIGGRFGIDGQLVIPEGETANVLQLPQKLLVVRQPNPGLHRAFPTQFEAMAWEHEPNTRFRVALEDRSIELVVDRYYPNAVVEEQVRDDGPEENPAVHLLLSHEGQQVQAWLFARNPERFGIQWGEAHVFFLEPMSEQAFTELMAPQPRTHPRGVVSLQFPGTPSVHALPVPEEPNQVVAIDGTPYVITFKDYFPDFALTPEGIINRSDAPVNPAVSFLLSGPEGTDTYLLFARFPEFEAVHGLEHTIPAEVSYTHAEGSALPPNAISLVRTPSGTLAAVLTGSEGERRQLESVELGRPYTHPWLGYEFEVSAYYPRAAASQSFQNRSNQVRLEALHLTARQGEETTEAWVSSGSGAQLVLGDEPLLVEYRPAEHELPFSIKLLDFRKVDYPGTQMAASYESDVQLTDPERGLILMRQISMNNPLRYRGFSFFQSSYLEGSTVETTVLSARSDPGTPLVYAGFLIIIAGVISMFVTRRASTPGPTQ